MKILICIFFMLTASWLQAQNNFYDLSVVSSSGNVVSMSAYKGKKLLIVIASPEVLRAKTAARYLGKIQSAYPAVSVLILPATVTGVDSATAAEVKQFPRLNNTLYSAATVSTKSKQTEQHPLLQWLTRKDSNKHFDRDITDDEQFYVVSESGVLYAALGKGVSDMVLKEVLTAGDVRPQQIITDINRRPR
jgi:glutathione peroxidase